jgi:hypothetical protein
MLPAVSFITLELAYNGNTMDQFFPLQAISVSYRYFKFGSSGHQFHGTVKSFCKRKVYVLPKFCLRQVSLCMHIVKIFFEPEPREANSY